jgi:hypothetical protein
MDTVKREDQRRMATNASNFENSHKDVRAINDLQNQDLIVDDKKKKVYPSLLEAFAKIEKAVKKPEVKK